MTLSELIQLRRNITPPVRGEGNTTLRQRFLLPPFSVLDARQGYWQERKRAWLELGMQSELGRGVNLGDISAAVAGITDPAEVQRWNEARRKKPELAPGRKGSSDNGLLGISSQARSHYRGIEANSFNSGRPGELQKRFQLNQDGRTMQAGRNNRTGDGACADGTEVHSQSGTSIFDPVLCELAYRWFSPKGGAVLDPFAGGSVRGIVAAMLGRSYFGIDLRQEQKDANDEQGDRICPDLQHQGDLNWVVGDAMNIQTLLQGEYDFIFSCPPYGDLECYSDDPRDLSTMSYSAFLGAYETIIKRSCHMLKADRFACFVVGDFRDRKTGNYRNFVSHTINAFIEAGLELYNEAILVTSVGSLPIRVGAQFRGYRKLGKTHQNVLVFLKGDAGIATQACGEVDLEDVVMPHLHIGTIATCDDAGNSTLLPGSQIEAALLCDILRGEARAAGAQAPRMWLGTTEGWQRLEDDIELTYLVGNTPYLSRQVFPNAPLPPAQREPATRMRRGQ